MNMIYQNQIEIVNKQEAKQKSIISNITQIQIQIKIFRISL